ncbi:protein JINGUBANG-like [Andrographis paniculata]|uniref:protein JINGUBANG-like n=1 Tax=Andrographis paniculata TaxID=175694 RepID=UPI0021E82130|nr:protein JINGUBANG-like [Andrographis paniculata]
MELPSPPSPAGRSLQSLLDEERRSSATVLQLPRKSSFQNNDDGDDDDDINYSQLSSPKTSCVSAASFPLVRAAVCPDSPWIRSPVRDSSAAHQLTYHCLASLYRGDGSVYSLAVAKNFVVTGSSSTRIHAWNPTDLADMGCAESSAAQIRSILAAGNLLVSVHADFRIRLWNIAGSSPPAGDKFRLKKLTTLPRKRRFFSRKKIPAHKDRISAVAINAADMLVYTASWDQTVKVWSITKNRCVDSFAAHDAQVNAVVVNQIDGCVFTCSSDGTVKIWRRVCKDDSCHILTVTLKFQPSPVNALALSVGASRRRAEPSCFLYSGSSDGLINFWTKEGASGRYNHGGFLQGHHFAVLCLAAPAAAPEMIVSGSEDATVRVWRREEASGLHSCLVVIDGHHGPVTCLAAVLEGNGTSESSKMGLLVYSASLDKTLKVWRVKVFGVDDERAKGKKLQEDEADTINNNNNNNNDVCKMSPVLSPSWVRKKIHGSHY